MLVSSRMWPLLPFLLGVLFVAAQSAKASTIIDFSEPGGGPFDPNYFASRGVVFHNDLRWVGFLLGEEALISTGFGSSGPFAHAISGRFDPEVTRISASVALAFQYVSTLQLATFDQNTDVISRTILQMNQLSSDPGFMGFGYVTVDSGPLPTAASSFLILNQFVRSPTAVGSEFAVRDITITPVPEPSGIELLAIGLVILVTLRRGL